MSTSVTLRAGQTAAVAPVLSFDTTILAGSVAASSIATYTRDFRAYLGFAGSEAAALDATTLARWRTHLAQNTEYSPNTINRMLSAVRRMIKEAAAQGYCSYETALRFGAVAGVQPKALKGRQKKNSRTRITVQQMSALCSAPDMRTPSGAMHTALLNTLASSGVRISEAVNLTYADIHYEEKENGDSGYYIEVLGKNETEPSRRPLSRRAHAHIEFWRAVQQDLGVTGPYVFTGFGGRGSRDPSSKPISPVSAWKTVQRYARKCKLVHVKPHDFRRFLGTQLAAKDIRLAQKALGHKSIETTARHYVLDDLPLGITDELY